MSAEVNAGTPQDQPGRFRVGRHEDTGLWTIIAPSGKALYTFADEAAAIAEAVELNTPSSVKRRRRTRFDPSTALRRAGGGPERLGSRVW
jgi:hypothetical protein